ncbi:MAG: galactofuranose transport system permease protein, partial [Thermomicrobiales bacterium]|nr:galactofuranose transport system permease protein [Thermomicrobiales bacterium]
SASTSALRLALPSWLRNASQTQRALSALVVLSLYNAIFTNNFLTLATLRVNLTQVATIVIVGVGMTLVIATGGIDLSVGALMAIAGMVAPKIFMSERGPLDSHWVAVPLAIVVPILVAGAFGVFNGTLVTWFRIQPIIATLVLFLGGRGIAKALSDGKLVEFRNPNFDYIGTGRPLGIPVQVILMALIVAVAAWVMRGTTFGRYVLATGGNEPAARLAGVPVDRVKIAVYAISGLLAGLAGLIVISLNTSADPYRVGEGMELDAIAAAAVGGTVLTGGRASVVGTLIGASIIHQIRYTLISHGVADGTTRIVVAATIILAVLLQWRGD